MNPNMVVGKRCVVGGRGCGRHVARQTVAGRVHGAGGVSHPLGKAGGDLARDALVEPAAWHDRHFAHNMRARSPRRCGVMAGETAQVPTTFGVTATARHGQGLEADGEGIIGRNRRVVRSYGSGAEAGDLRGGGQARAGDREVVEVGCNRCEVVPAGAMTSLAADPPVGRFRYATISGGADAGDVAVDTPATASAERYWPITSSGSARAGGTLGVRSQRAWCLNTDIRKTRALPFSSRPIIVWP